MGFQVKNPAAATPAVVHSNHLGCSGNGIYQNPRLTYVPRLSSTRACSMRPRTILCTFITRITPTKDETKETTAIQESLNGSWLVLGTLKRISSTANIE